MGEPFFAGKAWSMQGIHACPNYLTRMIRLGRQKSGMQAMTKLTRIPDIPIFPETPHVRASLIRASENQHGRKTTDCHRHFGVLRWRLCNDSQHAHESDDK
jgi:hypothetical protein